MERGKEDPPALQERFRSLKGPAGRGIPGPEPPIGKLLQPQPLARHWTSHPTPPSPPPPNSPRAVKAIPRLCQCTSTSPAASRNPRCKLITHCEKVIYPRIPELRALSGWCPLVFLNLVASNWLWRPPSLYATDCCPLLASSWISFFVLIFVISGISGSLVAFGR